MADDIRLKHKRRKINAHIKEQKEFTLKNHTSELNCFINSIIQIFFHTPSLRALLQECQSNKYSASTPLIPTEMLKPGGRSLSDKPVVNSNAKQADDHKIVQ